MKKNNRPTNLSFIAGIVIGTLTLRYGQNLGDDQTYKYWVIFLSPSLTILFSFFLNWLSTITSKLLIIVSAEFYRILIIQRLKSMLRKGKYDRDKKKEIKEKIYLTQMSDISKLIKLRKEITSTPEIIGKESEKDKNRK